MRIFRVDARFHRARINGLSEFDCIVPNNRKGISPDTLNLHRALVSDSILAGGPFRPSFGLSGAFVERSLRKCRGDCDDFTRRDRLTS